MIPNFYDGLIPNKFEDLMMLSSASICLAPIKLERSYGECGERQKKGDINMSRSGYETMSFIHRTKGPVSNWKGPRKGWKFMLLMGNQPISMAIFNSYVTNYQMI